MTRRNQAKRAPHVEDDLKIEQYQWNDEIAAPQACFLHLFLDHPIHHFSLGIIDYIIWREIGLSPSFDSNRSNWMSYSG